MPSELEIKLANKTKESLTIQSVSQKLNSTIDPAEIHSIIFETMDSLFSFHHSLILLMDSKKKDLYVIACQGYEKQPEARVALGVGVIGMAGEKKTLMRVNNLNQQRNYLATIRRKMKEAGRESELDEAPEIPGLKNSDSQMAIPLIFRDNLVGVFAVEMDSGYLFSQDDETLVSIISGLAASAINNSQTYERLKIFNTTLEDRVKKRTELLVNANRDLKDTQTQLIQSAKMASLGDLVAGVAHEINTPLGSIHSNANLVQRAHKIILRAFKMSNNVVYEDYPGLEKALKAIEEASSTSLTASYRIIDIVSSLRSFARLGEAELQEVNIHEGIDSTLKLVNHNLKNRIQIIKDFGELPLVRCYSNQLNQVFMNLLVNSIQAIEDKGSITIETQVENENVLLTFSDTGKGIPPDNLEKIFDPGFTTKGVGVGTGLGLSISYQIIKDHRGEILVKSKLGKGTSFYIKIPIKN